jgi:hypothetical protein
MAHGDSAKKLLAAYNQEHYRAFTLNDEEHLFLIAPSLMPSISATERRDHYEKLISHPGNPHHVKFIKKNKERLGFLWQTDRATLKKAVRWGIVKTHSITGKVISTLGNYRVAAHQRVAKGMVSNSQAIKLKLLDLFQDRFEALEDVESLANKINTRAEITQVLQQYIEKLKKITEQLSDYFSKVEQTGFSKETLDTIRQGLQADIERTEAYLALIKKKDDLSMVNSARAKDSVVEFVKQQMIHGLYELQAINQDMTYSRKRRFALTRGELNDFIEDARRTVDDHQADLRNVVTKSHHGLYASAEAGTLVTYDFIDDHLTPARERDVLLAISFIEGWDTLSNEKGQKPTVKNQAGEIEELATITATRWQTHRHFIAFFKSVVFYLLNMIGSVFISTRPWEEETWKKKSFHLRAAELRKDAKFNEPMWRKPLRFVKHVVYALRDVFYGIRDFGAELTFRMPAAILNDWHSSYKTPDFQTTLRCVSSALQDIDEKEKNRLQELLEQCQFQAPTLSKPASHLALMEYGLSGGEQNDILTAMVRGLTGFGTFFSHHIYAKDPVGGLLFTAGFAIGAGAIYYPALTSAAFGAAYTNWFTQFSYTMGSSPITAAIAGGGTQAELFAAAWDGVIHGPSGMTMNALYKCGEDPLTVGAYCLAAYGLGYVLANGVGGHPIPWLSEHMMADLGTVPESGYPIIGAKLAVALYEALVVEPHEHHAPVKIGATGLEFEGMPASYDPKIQQDVNRVLLISWLALNAKALPKLASKDLFAISQQIKILFNEEDSESLHKLLYPETPRSIAFQLVAIPLAYIPSILRFVFSLGLSTAAWFNGNPHPLEPAKRATMQLVNQAKRDVSRLVVFATQVVYIPYIMLTTFTKMLGHLVTMACGRVMSLFGIDSAHFFHRLFASAHVFFRSVGEYFYPTRVLRSVAVAHPTHTMLAVEDSYVKMVKEIAKVPSGGELNDEERALLEKPAVPAVSSASPALPPEILVPTQHPTPAMA